jgi:CheY-like chemotaxis protein
MRPVAMNQVIRIVFVEDVPAEALAVERALNKSGLSFNTVRVDSKEAFLRELETPPDVILSDHGLPAFDGFAALAVAKEKCPEVPFIFVTNALTREMEIEKLATGVSDYVLKSHLEDLGPTIRHALHESGQRRLLRLTWEERELILRKVVMLLDEFTDGQGYIPICASCKKIRDKQNQWHPPDHFFAERLRLKFTHGMCPDCAEDFLHPGIMETPQPSRPSPRAQT